MPLKMLLQLQYNHQQLVTTYLSLPSNKKSALPVHDHGWHPHAVLSHHFIDSLQGHHLRLHDRVCNGVEVYRENRRGGKKAAVTESCEFNTLLTSISSISDKWHLIGTGLKLFRTQCRENGTGKSSKSVSLSGTIKCNTQVSVTLLRSWGYRKKALRVCGALSNLSV